MSYLVVLRTRPDLDHMTPLAWKLLERGQTVHAVVSPELARGRDYRLELLRGYKTFHLHGLRGGAIGNYLRRTLPYALTLLVARRVRCVGVEWGHGLPDGYERPRSREGLLALLRTLARSLAPGKPDSQQTRTSFMAAARLLGVPVVCLPHGLNVKLDPAPTEQIAEMLERGPLPWADRNRFAAFVLNTEQQRQWHVEHAAGDPDVMQTWGSLRWHPDWFELNRTLAPGFEWPEETDRLKVVYMVPKWGNRVHADAAMDLVLRLQELSFASVAVMGHPRAKSDRGLTLGRGGDPLRDHPDVNWDALHDVSGADSVGLIKACDVVIDIGSSIGIEVLMQGKVLINPTYTHELTTFFDTIEGVAVVARSAEDVTGYLEAHANGDRHQVSPAAYEELLRQTVYGSREQPFDVPQEYVSRMADIAAGRTR